MTADEQYNSNVRNFFCSSDSSTGKPRPPLLLFLLLQKLQLYTAVVVSLVTSCLWSQLPASHWLPSACSPHISAAVGYVTDSKVGSWGGGSDDDVTSCGRDVSGVGE